METIQDPKLLERYMVKSDIRTLFSGPVPRFFLLRYSPGELMTTPFSPANTCSLSWRASCFYMR